MFFPSSLGGHPLRLSADKPETLQLTLSSSRPIFSYHLDRSGARMHYHCMVRQSKEEFPCFQQASLESLSGSVVLSTNSHLPVSLLNVSPLIQMPPRPHHQKYTTPLLSLQTCPSSCRSLLGFSLPVSRLIHSLLHVNDRKIGIRLKRLRMRLCWCSACLPHTGTCV